MDNFVNVDVYSYDGQLIYTGPMAYDIGEDVSDYDETDVSGALYKAQNTGKYRALEAYGNIKPGAFLDRAEDTDPYCQYDVIDIIDEHHPEYQDCVKALNDIEAGVGQPRRIIEPEDLSWDYIDKNTLWVAKMTGYRKIGTYEELKPYMDSSDLRDVDTLVWESQPEELQEFHKDYTYAVYEQNRHDLFYMKDFYNEWQKDPEQFKPKAKDAVIGKLSDYFSKMDLSDNLIVANYHGFGAGNHRAGNFYEAVQESKLDFDVIDYTRLPMQEWDDRPTHKVTIQTDDEAALNKFSRIANENAIKHSSVFGDGKYESPSDDGEDGQGAAAAASYDHIPEKEKDEPEIEERKYQDRSFEEKLRKLKELRSDIEENEPDAPDDDFELDL